MIELKIKTVEIVTVVELAGDIDAATTPLIQEQVFPIVKPDSKIILDMRQVSYLSSSGLRMLLLLYRTAIAQKVSIVLVGLTEEIWDTMSVTGFLDFFTTCDTIESGLALLR
ncbi:MAG TPA: anti-sigma factor antagonist [Xenococcaceae cyanobacterium]